MTKRLLTKKLVKELFELVKKKDIEKAVLISKSHPVGAIFESVIKNWGKPIDNIETIAERKRNGKCNTV